MFYGANEKVARTIAAGTKPVPISVKVVTVLSSLLACVALLEIVLRTLPVNEGFRALAVNDDNPIYRYTPNRTAVWSKGWNFSITNRVRTNNVGFISELNYDSQSTTPLMAIVGDSYIEAAMVPPEETVAALLRREVGDKGRVYSFGASGAALSQYLAYAKYARDVFHPNGLVVTVVGNDFDESLLRYKRVPGFHYFTQNKNGSLQLIRLDREIPPWRDFVAASSLGMYLAVNLEVTGLLQRSRDRLKGLLSPSSIGLYYAGNSLATADPIRIADSKLAVDAFLEQLPAMAGLAAPNILLMVDAARPELYDPASRETVKQSYFGIMRAYLMERATERGFEVADMEREFLSDYSRTGRRFEYPNDFHWNSVGHQVGARAVKQSALYRSVFGVWGGSVTE